MNKYVLSVYPQGHEDLASHFRFLVLFALSRVPIYFIIMENRVCEDNR